MVTWLVAYVWLTWHNRREDRQQEQAREEGRLAKDTVQKLRKMSWPVVSEAVQYGARLLVIEDLIYDVHEWIDAHPGGQRLLYECMGTDSTSRFMVESGVLHSHKHSSRAHARLRSLCVGRIDTGQGTGSVFRSDTSCHTHTHTHVHGSKCMKPSLIQRRKENNMASRITCQQ
jgi:cytochrome b involved in lipid metabolism